METLIIDIIGVALILFNLYRKRNDKEELKKMLKLAISMIIVLGALALVSIFLGK